MWETLHLAYVAYSVSTDIIASQILDIQMRNLRLITYISNLWEMVLIIT
jgi:hypothetical protein